MAAKSANLYARIEPDVKEKAESILSTLGIPASSANMFYKQIILQRGLPFEVKIPSARPVDIGTLSEAEFNGRIGERICGYAGWTDKKCEESFADIPQGLWFMMYEVEVSEQADSDLRGILNILLLNYNRRKMQADNLIVWKNRY